MATKYWRVGGTNTWSSTANWSTVSPTGATGAAIPVVGDDVVISNAGQTAGTINIGATATAKLNSWTVIGGTWTVAGATQVNVAGTFDCQNVTWTNTGLLSLQGTGASYDITASGTTFGCAVTFNALNVADSSFNLLSAFTTGATQTTTLTAGTLILNNFTLTTGIFSSGATNVRAIQFGTGNIALIHTTAGTAVVALANYSNFSCSGTGGFTSAMSVTRTFSVGSTGASNSITVNLALTSGASVPTFTAGGWFNHLNFTGSSFTSSTFTLNVNSLTLASGGTYTALTINAVGTGTITPAGKSLAAFTVNHTGTTTLSAALGTLVTGTTTLTLGTLDLAGFTLTTGIFSSSNSNTRAIAFGAGNIVLSHTTAATTVLSMATAAGFTWTGTGGFTVAAMSNTRTFSFGNSAGGTTTNAPNLTFTTGASVATITTASWFNNLDYGTTSFTQAASTLNLNALTLSSTGIYTLLSATMVGTGTITTNGKTIAAFTVNHAGTTTVAVSGISCTTFTITAGTIDFATFSLTCTNSLGSNTDLFAPLGTVNLNTITCPTYTVNGTVTMTSGQSLTATTSFVTATAFIFNGGTLTTPLFTHTSGTVTLGANLSPGVTGTYTLTQGTLDLAGFTLTTGIFSSNNTNTRDIAFGTGNIALSHTTAATTVLSMATLTAFTYTGTGGFTVADMAVTRTFTCGSTAGGTTSNAPNLTFTTGASVATITTASWFNKLDYGTTSFTQAASTLNLNALTLSSTGTYTALILSIRGTGTLTYNGKTTAAVTLFAGTPTISGTLACTTFTVNGPAFDFTSGTINPSTSFVLTSGSFTYNGGTLSAVPTFTQTTAGTTATFNFSYSLAVTGTYTMLSTLILADGVTLSTGIFSSSTNVSRSIAFGSASAGNINLTHTTAATTVLQLTDTTNLSVTGPGGFTVADMSNTRTFVCGTSGGSETNAINLTFTTGASVATLSNTSRFKSLNFGTTSFAVPAVAGVTIYGNLILSSTGTYTAFVVSMSGTSTITPNGKALGATTVNTTGTITLAGALLTGTLTMTTGTLDCAFFNLGRATTESFTYSAGTILNMGTLTYTSITITNGGTFTMSSGTLACSSIIVGTSAPLLGYFIYNGGTIANIAAAGVSLLQVRGDVTLNASLNLNGSSVAIANSYQHTGGTLILNNYNLTVGSYRSLNSDSASPATEIQFGSGFIYVGLTSVNQYCITINTVWNFINSGTGGFSFDMNVTRKIAVFTSVGSATTFNPLGDTFDSILDQAFNVFVTSGSSALTIDVNSRFRTLNFTGSSCTFVASGGSVYCQTLILGSAASYTGLPGLTGQIVMNGPGSITSNGKTLGKINISQQISGYYTTTLNDALACSDRITIISGIISSAYNITALYFLANSLTHQELLSTNNIYLTLTGTGASAGASGVFQGISGGSLVISAGIVIYLTASTAKNFIGGGATYPTLMNGGAGILTISDSNTFDTLTNNVAPTGFSFTAGTTQTVTNFTVNGGGTGVNLVTLTSTAPGTQYSLSKSSGTVSVLYLSIRDSDATGGASWYAGVLSTNVSNNTGWFFTAVPPPSTNTGNFFLFF